MSESDLLVARNVKRLRGERKVSMSALALQAGLSKQTLSKIEQGVGNPTLGTIEALSMALGTSVRSLMTEWGSPVRVQSSSAAEWQSGLGGDIRILDQVYGSGYVRSCMVRLEPSGHDRARDGLSAGSIYQVLVISGDAEMGPEGQTVRLAAGDFVKFPADVPHILRAIEGTVVLHLITSFPQVPQVMPFGDPR
ncbi:XRE family transcriptional regulator [Cryobacterium frigoriphilum]|uniref:XRE family transcriptional regulator n=1 Tax=Cryobacterium frigoriphilum TaxID=1259150 RepID=A0A4R9A558_9MICO|nr:XRE family transcriptional regulator [Cryobacterium frigoriphilum]TFD52277.1 XRE family transcriptional regulator [Cryobacterium frigoriphilum]